MDLLKGITDGLRGDDDARHGGERGTTADAASGDARESSAADARGSGSADRAGSSDRSDEQASNDRSEDDSAERDGSEESASDGDPERDDEHVCSFCRTAFDAERGACPECDAEIVFRGGR